MKTMIRGKVFLDWIVTEKDTTWKKIVNRRGDRVWCHFNYSYWRLLRKYAIMKSILIHWNTRHVFSPWWTKHTINPTSWICNEKKQARDATACFLFYRLLEIKLVQTQPSPFPHRIKSKCDSCLWRWGCVQHHRSTGLFLQRSHVLRLICEEQCVSTAIVT